MTCTTCGRENPAHLTFCQECGQRLGPRIAPPTPPIGIGQEAYAALESAPRASPRAATALGVQPGEPSNVARPVPTERRCKVCDTVNGPTLRYCTSCGSTLDAVAAPAVAAARVVELGPGPLEPMPARTCPRCRGVADPAAQFCKFCGASLPGAETAAVKAEPARPNGAGKNPHEETIVTGPPNNMSGDAPRAAAPGPAPRPAPAPSGQPIGPSGAGFAAAAAPPAFPRPGSVVPAQAAPPSIQHGSPSRAPAPPPAPAAPAAIQRGRLVVIAKSGADGPSYPFGDLLDIGRSEGGVVVAEDPYLSPRHVRLVWQAGKMILRDLASTNGVYLRLAPSRDIGMRRSGDANEITVSLNDGDLVLVGQQVLRFDVLNEGEGGFGPAQEHGTLVFGSPAAPRYARLCQRTVEGIARDVYYIRKVETVLGRESGDVVFTEDPFLSRRHAAIRMLTRDAGGSGGAARPPISSEGARFYLVDLGSSNGTFLRVRGDIELVPGDHFRVGQQLFRVDFEGPRGVGE